MPPLPKKIIFFTEWKNKTGTGHLSRCISMGDAFIEKKFEYNFIVDSEINYDFSAHGIKPIIFNWRLEPEKVKRYIENNSLVIIDSYLASKKQLKLISGFTRHPVFISDARMNYYPKGIVIIGNSFANKLSLIVSEDVHYLLGIKYALLRKEFWDVKDKEISPKLKKILISLGDSAPDDLNIKIARVLLNYNPDLNITIMSIKKNKLPKLKNVLFQTSRLSASEMVCMFQEHDIIISNGGQTLLECIRTGVPSISLKMADNQIRNIKTLSQKDLTMGILNTNKEDMVIKQLLQYFQKLESYDNRLQMKSSSRNFLDGQGARRACREVLDYYGYKNSSS